jgi:hypothetical protein
MVLALSFVLACTPSADTAGDTAADTASDSAGEGQPAVGHKACGPDDGVVQEFLVGTDVCDGPPAPPFARLTPLASTYAAGDTFSIKDANLLASWQTGTDQGVPAQTAEVTVTAVGDGVEFTWTLVAEDQEHSGRAAAELCAGDEPQCG